MRRFVAALVSAAVASAILLWISAAAGQPAPGKHGPAKQAPGKHGPGKPAPGKHGPGKQGRGPGGPMMNVDPQLGLLRAPAVAKELGLSDDQVKRIEQLIEEMRSKPSAKLQGMSPEERRAKAAEFGKLSPEERHAKLGGMMKGRGEGMQAKLREILTSEQLNRLHQIGLQMRGPMALADPKVMEDLKITDEQRQQLAAVRDKAMQQIHGLMSKPGDWQSMTEESRQKATELRQQAGEEILKLLTPEQREAFEKMKGAKLELPARGEGPRGKRAAKPE